MILAIIEAYMVGLLAVWGRLEVHLAKLDWAHLGFREVWGNCIPVGQPNWNIQSALLQTWERLIANPKNVKL